MVLSLVEQLENAWVSEGIHSDAENKKEYILRNLTQAKKDLLEYQKDLSEDVFFSAMGEIAKYVSGTNRSYPIKPTSDKRVKPKI